ncbi:MAG: hypothetical protein ACR2NG_01725 [Acidimicrobiia bacterium]
MAVQLGEGTEEIIYGETSIPAGPRTYGGYLSRPDGVGEWPTILIFGPMSKPTSSVKNMCRVFARHGIAALAPDLESEDVSFNKVAQAAASFVMNPAGDWSNAEFGFGVLAFEGGVDVAAQLVGGVNEAMAFATVGSALDSAIVERIAPRDVHGLYIGSREDDGSGVDLSLDARDALPLTTFAVYPDGDTGFWSDDSPGFSEARYFDTRDRLMGFFGLHLPGRA